MNAISRHAQVDAGGTAQVLARDGAQLMVQHDGEPVAARRALSCLIEPEPGDLVLMGGPAARPYVLAVLERAGTAPLRLATEGDLEIGTPDRRLALRAGSLVVAADSGDLTLSEMRLSGARASVRIGVATVIADAIETVATRLLTRAKRCFRFIEGTDQTRARDIDQRASGHLHLRGETAALQAGFIVKIDSKQIHMG